MPAKSLKSADKQTILKKLVTEMKRRYGGAVPKETRSTFETLLFAACLEDASQADAEAAYARLLDSFFDLNEIRVSSVSEIQAALGDLTDAAWKAMRIREALQHVFEKHYAFDLEFLRRKTQEQALKELSQISYQTPYARAYVAQHALGAHVLPLDASVFRLLVWLGLADPTADAEAAAEDLKSAVKKSEGGQVCHLLKCVATDPELREHFEETPSRKEVPDPFQAAARLADLFKNPQRKKRKPKAAGKVVSRKKPEKKKTASRAAAKSAPRNSGKKSVTKKVPDRKTNARKRTK